MTSPLARAQAKDFPRAHKDILTYFTYGATSVACSFSSTDDDIQLAEDGGGEMAIYDLQVTCLIADLPSSTLPSKGEVIVVNGTSYQVEKTNVRPGSALARIMCSNLDI